MHCFLFQWYTCLTILLLLAAFFHSFLLLACFQSRQINVHMQSFREQEMTRFFFHSLFSLPTIFGRFCFSFGNVSLWSLKDGRVVTARAHCSDNWVSWRMFGLAAVRARERRAVCNIYAIICLWTRRKKRTNTSTKLESVMWEKTILWCVHNKTRNAENSIIIVRWWLKNVSCIKCQKCFFFFSLLDFDFVCPFSFQ